MGRESLRKTCNISGHMALKFTIFAIHIHSTQTSLQVYIFSPPPPPSQVSLMSGLLLRCLFIFECGQTGRLSEHYGGMLITVIKSPQWSTRTAPSLNGWGFGRRQNIITDYLSGWFKGRFQKKVWHLSNPPGKLKNNKKSNIFSRDPPLIDN